MFIIHTKEIKFGDKTLTIETGKIARQATGSVMVTMGNSVVLCAVTAAKKAKEGIDFFPLSVHYVDKFYAAGKVPGGYLKRESRPSERETLTSRLIDRPLRPLFPDNFKNEVQVVCTTMSYDEDNNPDILALIGASAALAISGIPLEQPVGAARVGYKDGEYTLNPSTAQLADGSQLDLIVAGTKDAVLMVESTAHELSEEVMLGAVNFGHKAFQPVIKAIAELAKAVGNKAWEVPAVDNAEIAKLVKGLAEKKIAKAYSLTEKADRKEALDVIKDEVIQALVTEKELDASKVSGCFKDLEKDIVRTQIVKTKKRIDGRTQEQIRQIVCEVDLLPNVHGSSLFTRGETQSIVAVTLGTGDDEQMIDDIEGNRKERFMLHYNFPPYSVGEAGRMGPPGRREIGHGKLAFRAIAPLLPTKEVFPYTIRVVSEITESNGSSSMATVCGTSLSLMAAGVPLPSPIAGIAMGLVMEKKDYVVLSDIMGDEDHLGDMDFKVAGTEKGVTALQMDIKISGITSEIMEKALDQAKDGRLHILSKMAEAITESRIEISSKAPQITSIKVPQDKIGTIIGPGGKMIKEIIEKTGVKMDISDDGTVNIASTSEEGMREAIAIVKDLVAVPEVGKIYDGVVTRITDFGAFVEYMKKTEGLLHVSEMSNARVNHPSDVLKEGQKVRVKLLSVEANGKVRLSMKFEGGAADTNADTASNNNEDKKPTTSSDSAEVIASMDSAPREEKRHGDNKDRRKNNRRPNNNRRPSSDRKPEDRKDSPRSENRRPDNKKPDNRRNDRSDDRNSERSEPQPTKKKLRFF